MDPHAEARDKKHQKRKHGMRVHGLRLVKVVVEKWKKENQK